MSDRGSRRSARPKGQGALLRGALAASVTVAPGVGGVSASLSSRLDETQARRDQGGRALALVFRGSLPA